MNKFNDEALKDLTICIFTLNRHQELTRLVKFLSGTKMKILILDASNESKFLFRNDNLEYFHVPNMPLQERLRKFAELATTKYLLLSPDDDYWAPNGVCEVLKFLEKNLDYASAQGLRIRFFDFPFFHWIPDYVNQMTLDFSQENKVERLRDMATGMHYIYSVIRRNEYIKITNCLREVNSIKRNSMMMSELIFNYTLPLLGKHKVLPVFYSARKAHPNETGDVNFKLWVNDKSDRGAVKFSENIIDFYTKELDIIESQASSVFHQLTKEFSKPKQEPEKKLKSFKKSLRIVFTRTKLRGFCKISKVKYLYFYKLLFLNKTFFMFASDILQIKSFLNKNRIK
jgi:glycosyltransferase domain-containing protein